MAKSTKSTAAKSTAAKSGQQAATTGAKVQKVTGTTRKGAANVAATEAASLKTRKGQGQKAAASGQQAAAKGKGKKTAAPKGGQQGQRGRASEFPLETKVRAADGVELRDGSFAQKISALAAKPITIGALIDAAVAKRSEFFRNSAAAASADAARRAITVRVRDLVRAEYLEEV